MLPSIFGESMFDDMFDRAFDMDAMFGGKNPLYGKHAKNLMKTDIRETDNSYELDVDLPGFQKEEISLELKDGILTIRAEHKESEEEQAKKGEYVRRERRYGSFARTFDVSGIDESGITAAYHNGILELTLPKQAPVVPQARQITIG